MCNSQAMFKSCVTLEKEIDILTFNIQEAENKANTLFYVNKMKQERALLIAELRALKRKLTEKL